MSADHCTCMGNLCELKADPYKLKRHGVNIWRVQTELNPQFGKDDLSSPFVVCHTHFYLSADAFYLVGDIYTISSFSALSLS